MYITLDSGTIESEHICCAFSDKKCVDGYRLKKEWLKQEFQNGYVFKRLDERAKVFIEYGPAENAWVPISAPGFMHIGCFWVSGKYKKKGHGKRLLQGVVEAAKEQQMKGLVTVAGLKKYHFMSDTKWLQRNGFTIVDQLPSGFCLLAMDFGGGDGLCCFNECTKKDGVVSKRGCVAYYSNRCPYTEYHVTTSLVEACAKRDIPLEIIKLETREQAQSSPTPATIFTLFVDGEFVTTDVSICMDTRFDKALS